MAELSAELGKPVVNFIGAATKYRDKLLPIIRRHTHAPQTAGIAAEEAVAQLVGQTAKVSTAYCTLEAFIAGGDELGMVSEETAIKALHVLLHALPSIDPDARPLNLKWGRHDGRGEYHIEWHAPCGCAYHPEPKPHMHPCIKHAPIEAAPQGVAPQREGWQWVPKEPTDAMRSAAHEEYACGGGYPYDEVSPDFEDIYEAMLAAAPATQEDESRGEKS